MKKAESIKILSFFSLLLFMISCDKKDKDIDIVKCKVNGKSWVNNCESNDGLFGCESLSCYYITEDQIGLILTAADQKSESTITLSNYSGPLILGHNKIGYRDASLASGKITNKNCMILDTVDLNFDNYIDMITIDTINYVIEGKFQLRVHNMCGDTATITEGYFKTHFIF